MTTQKGERLDIRSSDDVVRVRQLARTMAIAAGLSLVDQTKIVTAASELARNTLDYGGGGDVRLGGRDWDERLVGLVAEPAVLHGARSSVLAELARK